MPLSIYLCYILAEMKDPDYAVELESLLMALADKTRLRLLYLMADGEISVGDLTAAIGVSQPKISRPKTYAVAGPIALSDIKRRAFSAPASFPSVRMRRRSAVNSFRRFRRKTSSSLSR